MVFLLILLYSLTLVHLASTIRVKSLLVNLALQGLILFGIAFYHLEHIDLPHLLFILIETIVVKAVVIPIFLNKVRKKNKILKVDEKSTSVVTSLIAISLILLVSFVLSNFLHDEHMETKFFTIAIASILGGFFYVLSSKSIFIQLIGYIIIENGIFLLSLAVGHSMPMVVNMAILMDIFISVLILGFFVNRIGNVFNSIHSDELTQLKD
jgi:hydrogenase-4 component E